MVHYRIVLCSESRHIVPKVEYRYGVAGFVCAMPPVLHVCHPHGLGSRECAIQSLPLRIATYTHPLSLSYHHNVITFPLLTWIYSDSASTVVCVNARCKTCLAYAQRCPQHGRVYKASRDEAPVTAPPTIVHSHHLLASHEQATYSTSYALTSQASHAQDEEPSNRGWTERMNAEDNLCIRDYTALLWEGGW